MPRRVYAGSIQILSLFVIHAIFLLTPQTTWAKADNQLEAIIKPANRERLSTIDRSLLLELVKLAQFNIRFHQEANRHQKWRALTYAAGRESGTAVSFASSLIDLEQRVRGLDDSSLISRNALKNVVNTALVGSTISGSASSLELAQNTLVMINARKQGYSPKASAAFVRNIVDTTDRLFDERKSLAAIDPIQRRRQAYELEDTVLHRLRQQLLFEFCAWSCQSRGRAWRENTFYGIDALQNFTRMSAAITGLRGFVRPELGGAVAITTMVANGITTINPLFCGLVGFSMHRYQLMKLSKEFPTERPAVAPDETSAMSHLQDLQSDSAFDKQYNLLKKALFLSSNSLRLDAALDRDTRDIERLRRVAQQQTFAGPVIGMTGIPASILGTIAFYDYRMDRDTTNKLLFSGRIPAMSGQAFALIQTPYTFIAGVILNRRLDRLQQSPSQILDNRLQKLDELEEQLKATNP